VSNGYGSSASTIASTFDGGSGIRFGYEYMKLTNRRSGITCTMSPENRIRRSAQWSTCPPAK
jgi:hypothetical protein